MRKYTVYLIFVNVLVVGLLAWTGHERYQDFRSYHNSIAEEATASAARAIAAFIAEKKRQVALFARDYMELIQQFMHGPDNDELYEQVSSTIATYFPDFFTFTVADTSGEPLREDFEGYVGELCKGDLRKFAEHGKQSPRIHPHHEVYHFDIMAPLSSGPGAGTLFISFHADILGNVLRNAQSPGHQLMLIDPALNLIEVTADGARINWERDDYRLTADETNRVLYANKVSDTVWDVVDLNLSGLFADFRNKLLFYSILIAVLFMVASVIMYIIVRREERLRIRAERNKDEFLAVVSHELRSPITAIRGFLSLIESECEGKATADMNQYIGISINNCDRMSLLIDDLLDLQKIEAGKMTFDIKRKNLKQLVSACIENNKGYCDLYDASISLHTDADDILVDVDPSRFEQVLSNLLSNAIKYGAQQDNILVSIERDGECARVSVTDHGQGIPESEQHRVFSRFSQLGKRTSTHAQGTGLGLSIVKDLIERQGGHAGFETTEGQGSTFYIELPLA